jgi:hypothetical protein
LADVSLNFFLKELPITKKKPSVMKNVLENDKKKVHEGSFSAYVHRIKPTRKLVLREKIKL